ncbi:MAG: TraB family protein [Bradymonadaceae bacterium]
MTHHFHRAELDLGDKHITLLSLAHVSPQSLDELEAFIEDFEPDALCVELDARRLHWLENRDEWENLELLAVIRKKEMSLLSSYLALRIFQKRFGSFEDAEPGDGMWRAVEAARKCGAEVVLADRDMLVTGLRAWRHTPGYARPRIALALTAGTLRRTRPREDMTEPEGMESRLQRLGRRLPHVKRALLDEREACMAHRILETPGERIVVLVNLPHFETLRDRLTNRDVPQTVDLLHRAPPKSLSSRIMPWLISVIIAILFVVGFLYGDPEKLQNAALTWGIVNGICTAIFTFAAWGHPWSVLAASVSAPIVSLNPVIGAGVVGGFVQILVVPPSIRDIEKVGDDIAKWRGWWTNRLSRIVLIFFFANLGSTIGTFVALGFFPDLFS